jgi:hypothetical protein
LLSDVICIEVGGDDDVEIGYVREVENRTDERSTVRAASVVASINQHREALFIWAGSDDQS